MVNCDNPCVLQAAFHYDEPMQHNSEACTLTLTGQLGTAIYQFAPLMESSEPCVVTMGPTGQSCGRGICVACTPWDNTGMPNFDAGTGNFDLFTVSFFDTKVSSAATTARTYFGSDTVHARLVCGSTLVVNADEKPFHCITYD
jgi:hypothetical protein